MKNIERIKELKKELQGYWGIYTIFLPGGKLEDVSFAQLNKVVNIEDSNFKDESEWVVMGYGKHDVYWRKEDGWTRNLGTGVRTGFLKQNLYPTKQEAQRQLIFHLMSGTSSSPE